MLRDTEAPILFFAPFVSSSMGLEPAWIDYNGHLNLAYYHVLFDRAVDEVWAMLGLGPDYAAERGMTTFAAENHILYRREVKLADRVRVTVQLMDYDEKRIHLWMEMRHAGEGWLAATSEIMTLHVDVAARRVTSMPPDIFANLATMKSAHTRLPRPADVGRVISMRPRLDNARGKVLN